MGVVTGTSAQSQSIFKDMWARIKGITGGHLGSYDVLLDEATTHATAYMMIQAKRMGCTDIIRMKYVNCLFALNI